jgi:hypothetical protein
MPRRYTIVEQFEPPGELRAEAQPVDAAPVAEAADPPPFEPETVDELRAANARLTADNAAMVARIAQLEAPPPERWMPLKRGAASCCPPQPYEHVRRLAADGEIRAKRVGKKCRRWHIDVASVDAYLKQNAAK